MDVVGKPMSSQEQVEALEQEIAQLRTEAQRQSAAQEYLRSQLVEALRTVELAKKQLMLLEMQQIEIQSLRNQVTNFKAQLAFSQEREGYLEPAAQASPEQRDLMPQATDVIIPAPHRAHSGPSLPGFLRRVPDSPVTS